jgi:hypothetical protein
MRLLRAAVGALVLGALLSTPAGARTVHFGGRAVDVPSGWPVYRLAEHPRMCVRMDRRAVYLGMPGSQQRCPSGAIGRRRAILVPAAGARPRAGTSALVPPAPVATGTAFTGLGFDACAAPSARTMANWAVSPYRAVGVYIGGVNRACSQPNLTATWVGERVASGWHLIPTYVGLQAPTSACADCAKLSSSRASIQGAEAARDAVAKATLIGIGPGSPIYFDMEAYSRTSSATAATLSFLSAWTEQLHGLGYVSGVYSSSASGIADLARAIGSSYSLPDQIWTANWNGAQNTLDPNLPRTAWPAHERIHQYRGGHNETYGLITINVDNDYVDALTVGLSTASARPALPPLTVKGAKPVGGAVEVWVRCGESCAGHIVLRRSRLGLGSRAFRLAAGRSHTFRLRFNSRGGPLLRQRGLLRARLLVAIEGARTTRAVGLRRAR